MNAQSEKSLSDQFPAGCYIGFNAAVDRKAAEQLAHVCGQAVAYGYKGLTISMTSVGGLLEHAYYAFGVLDALPLHIVTHNIGSIQSAANMLFLCGDERYASEGATFFFHQTYFQASEGLRMTEALISERLKSIRYDDNRTAAILAAKTGRPIEEVREWQNSELVMNTDAAIKHGVIHGVKPLVIPERAFFHQVVV